MDIIEGIRHIKVANVKLCCDQSVERSKNPDRWFAAGIMKHIVDFALVMGENNVAILGNDDKAYIPVYIPAATKQSPILINMKYPVLLSDHTFVVASKHQLIPSIYASRETKPSGPAYSSLTHAPIRALKYDNADAFTEFDDLKDLLENDNFIPLLK